MKKLIFLPLIFLSCSSDDDDFNIIQTNEKLTIYRHTNNNSLTQTDFNIFSFEFDSVQYITVVSSTGTAIIKHK